MRMRKLNLKTEFIEPEREFSRFKLVKATPDYASHTSKLIYEPKIHRHSKQVSSVIDCGPLEQQSNNMNKIRSWDRIKNLMEKKDAIKKNSINLSDIDTLKNHLENVSSKRFLHKRTITEPNLRITTSKKKREKSLRQPMNTEKYKCCCQIIDNIFKKISILKEIGYAEAKINEWILNFCENRRPFMKEIFMKNISKSLYTLQEQFEFQRSSKIIKEKIKFPFEKSKDILTFIQPDELQEYSKYLEDILIQKNSVKAKEIQSSIIDKMSTDLVPKLKNQFFVFTKKEPTEVYNFVNELSLFEHKYGDFITFSKVNKLRFNQLNKVQKNLKQVYEQLLEGEIKNLIKFTSTDQVGQHCAPITK